MGGRSRGQMWSGWSGEEGCLGGQSQHRPISDFNIIMGVELRFCMYTIKSAVR